MPRWFGGLGVAGGVARPRLGVCEAAADWTFVGSTFWASLLGFMIWVLVARDLSCSSEPMSSHALFRPPPARNEPVHEYAPGSPERASLQLRLEQMRGERIEIPSVIGGKDVAAGRTEQAVMPHDKEHVLADVHQAGARARGAGRRGGGRRMGGLVALAVGGPRRGVPARGRAPRRARGATR